MAEETTGTSPSASSMKTTRVNRRRFAQGAAAGAAALGMAVPAIGRVAAQETTTIKFWTHTHPPMVDLNTNLVEQFMTENPEITVEYEIIPNNEFATKMLTSMGTGTGPDIINMDDSAMRSIYIPRGLVQEVDPVSMGYGSLDELKAAYIPTALEGSTDGEGKVYGVPSEFNVTAIAVNTAAMTEVGLDPASPPATWEEVATQGQQLVIKDGDTFTRRGFDFVYLHAGWYHNQLGTLMLQTGGRYVAEDGTTVTVDSPEMVEALHIWYDMIYESQIADPNVANQDATVPYQDFLDGNIAMTMFNPWGMGLITPDSVVGENWAIAPMPQKNPGSGDSAASPVAEGENGPVTPLYAYYWAVNAQTTDEAKKAAAFKLIGFLSSFPGRWLSESAFIQPKVGWEESEEALAMPFIEVWSAEMLKGKFQPVVPAAEQVDTIMKATLESSLFAGEDPQAALSAAKPEIDDWMTCWHTLFG
jgi:ABC-type glycerol-3-phosphate transport system substrate-binding protein